MRNVVALLLFVSAPAFAADIIVNWTLPTLNDDGSPIQATGPTALTQTRIEWGSCSSGAFGTKQGEVVVPIPATTTTITGLARDRNVCIRGYSKNASVESVPSAVVLKKIPAVGPAAPTVTAEVKL